MNTKNSSQQLPSGSSLFAVRLSSDSFFSLAAGFPKPSSKNRFVFFADRTHPRRRSVLVHTSHSSHSLACFSRAHPPHPGCRALTMAQNASSLETCSRVLDLPPRHSLCSCNCLSAQNCLHRVLARLPASFSSHGTHLRNLRRLSYC